MNKDTTLALSIIFGAGLIAIALYLGLKQGNFLTPEVDKPDSSSAVATSLPLATTSPLATPILVASPSPIITNPPTPVSSPTSEIYWKKSDLITALSQKTTIPENEIKFSVGEEIKEEQSTLLRGTVSREGEMGGAGFFAIVDQNGVKVTYAGQGVPQCSEVNPYNYPISWADYCIDQNDNTVAR